MKIRTSVDPWMYGVKKWNLTTQSDSTNHEVAPLTEETYKLLERPRGFPRLHQTHDSLPQLHRTGH